jgi:disulfide bond formation protein DsbB
MIQFLGNFSIFVVLYGCKTLSLFQVVGVYIPCTQCHYRRLILLLNTTYTATCFGRTTIFMAEMYY